MVFGAGMQNSKQLGTDHYRPQVLFSSLPFSELGEMYGTCRGGMQGLQQAAVCSTKQKWYVGLLQERRTAQHQLS